MIHVTVLAPLVEELQEELSEVSFISVIVEASNGKPVPNNDGSILFSLNSWNQSKFLEVHSVTGKNMRLLLIKLKIQ